MTMGVLWDTGDMEKASIYSVASEKGDAVLLAQTLRNAQAVRDAAPAKLAVPRASVRKGHCAPWTPV